jgi:hypothetical protein
MNEEDKNCTKFVSSANAEQKSIFFRKEMKTTDILSAFVKKKNLFS